jgi:peptidoglycan/xylan/chitin deacetylase (PgdA/CDA1 family)
MRFYRPGFPACCLYPDAIFRIKTNDRNIYLSFDDGPDPESTPVLLEILKKHEVKAIFFCNGSKAEKYPVLINKILEYGHVIGNHSYGHPDGWRTLTIDYLSDISKASKFTSGNLFRPPYGHLKLKQYRILKKEFKIIFWDLMPYDFDVKFGKDRSLHILKKKIRPGSIIVLHDKPTSTALEFLEEFIIFAKGIGYEFKEVTSVWPRHGVALQ